MAQVEAALRQHPSVLAAEIALKQEQANRQRWESGNYEFNVRAGMAQRQIATPGQSLKEWDIALERPVRLPNKLLLDREIGREGVERAVEMLGDARHEAGRTLLKLWFNWQREQAQTEQWRQQVELLKLQADSTEKRLKAGDAPKMELSQAMAAMSQASVALQQASARARLASNELLRQFPDIALPPQPGSSLPQPIGQDYAYWKQLILEHNHELGWMQAETRIQKQLAARSRADRLPDPSVGLRHSSEMGGNEKVTGLYVSIPLSFGLRSIQSEHAQLQADLAENQEVVLMKRLEGDIYAAHTQAVSSYQTWLQARDAAESVRQNAELAARAYSLGESSLSDTLAARRMALEATMAERLARLDANEARFRLLLDAHQLWAIKEHAE